MVNDNNALIIESEIDDNNVVIIEDKIDDNKVDDNNVIIIEDKIDNEIKRIEEKIDDNEIRVIEKKVDDNIPLVERKKLTLDFKRSRWRAPQVVKITDFHDGSVEEVIKVVLENETLLESSCDRETIAEEAVENRPVIFKKTLSRVVAFQAIAVIKSDTRLKKLIGSESLNREIQDIIDFAILNNNYEWKYFIGKKLSTNFIINTIKFFNENNEKISAFTMEFKEKHWLTHYEDNLLLAMLYTAVSEFLSIHKSGGEKDYKKILINEYINVCELFINDIELKFIHGMLNNIFNKIEADDLTAATEQDQEIIKDDALIVEQL